jgi:hypothetical protein
MPQTHAFLGAIVAAFALLVVLGFSAFLITLGARTPSPLDPGERTRRR